MLKPVHTPTIPSQGSHLSQKAKLSVFSLLISAINLSFRYKMTTVITLYIKPWTPKRDFSLISIFPVFFEIFTFPGFFPLSEITIFTLFARNGNLKIRDNSCNIVGHTLCTLVGDQYHQASNLWLEIFSQDFFAHVSDFYSSDISSTEKFLSDCGFFAPQTGKSLQQI